MFLLQLCIESLFPFSWLPFHICSPCAAHLLRSCQIHEIVGNTCRESASTNKFSWIRWSSTKKWLQSSGRNFRNSLPLEADFWRGFESLGVGVISFQVGRHKLSTVAGKGINGRNEMAKIVKMIRSARLQGQHRHNFVSWWRDSAASPRHNGLFLGLPIHVFPQIAKLLEFLLQVWDELGMCVLKRACWYRCRVPLQGAAVRVLCVLWSWPAGAAAGRRCRVRVQGTILSKGWLQELGVLLQGIPVRVQCALWSLGAGVAAGVAGPWWRLRLCRSKKGERLVATKKHLVLSGVYAGVYAGVMSLWETTQENFLRGKPTPPKRG